ncbi:MAG: conjugal transfer protein TraF [Gammaproteobacteria bacterium]|nr:conjugal transfer protein TraF [Gammaproteobacteria bacterium]
MERKPGSRLKPKPESVLLGLMAFMMVVLLLMVLVLAEQAGAAETRPWCFSQAPVRASSMYSGNHSLGWHFYCDREEETAVPESVETPAAEPEPESTPPPEDEAETEAMKKIRELRQQLEQKRAAAILDPTTENMVAYLRLQQETLERAAVFSDVFRRTVWSTPELDYTLRRPVGALAKRLWSDGRRAERDGVLARLGERYGLIYLGDADCEGCRVFGPLLRAFSLRHGLDVLAVSLDGNPLEGWPEAVPDMGRAERLGLGGAPLPAVVLFDTRTNKVQPVGFGVLAEDQLAERIFLSVSREVGSDF